MESWNCMGTFRPYTRMIQQPIVDEEAIIKG